MALSYLFDPNKQFQDKNGVNNVGGYLYVFINDSDDHAPTYCNFTGTLNPERIVLDNNGRAVVIVDELKTYRIEVYDRSGNMLWSQYPVRPTNVIYGDYNVYNADIYGTPDEIDVDVVMYASGVKKFTIKLANAVKTVIGNIQDTISSIVETVSTKADKVQGATAGNLASLDASGNLTDSGKKTADFKTKQTAVTDPTADGYGLSFIDSVTQNANGEITPHKKTVQDGTTMQKGVVQLNNAIDSTSTTEAATPKAVKDAYDDLNNKIVARAVFLSQAEWAVQSQLPGDPAKVYYVENGTGEDAYTVYVWKESTREYVEVDESSIDLDGYWHDAPNTTGTGNVVTNITLGNDGVPQVEKGMSAEPAFSVLPVNKGGTGKTTGKAATNNLFSDINNVNTDPDDTARIVFKYGSPSDSNGIFFARAITNLWNYIKSKISSVLGLSENGYTGNAATATSATTATNYASSGGIANAINAKQDTISDLATIRSGASAGASALQPSGNGSNLSVTPDGTSTGYDLGSSTTLKAFAQKFKNLVGALKALAFKDKVSDSDIDSVAWSKVSSKPTKLSDFTDDITQSNYIASGTGSDKPASGAAVAQAVVNKLGYNATSQSSNSYPILVYDSGTGKFNSNIWLDLQNAVINAISKGLRATRIGQTAIDLNNLTIGNALGNPTSCFQVYEWWNADKSNVANKPYDSAGTIIVWGYTDTECCQLVLNDNNGPMYYRRRGQGTWSSWVNIRDASWINSGTFGTDRIADDAITAAKVKDNETLPVNISGKAGSSYTLIGKNMVSGTNGYSLLATLEISNVNAVYAGAMFAVVCRGGGACIEGIVSVSLSEYSSSGNETAPIVGNVTVMNCRGTGLDVLTAKFDFYMLRIEVGKYQLYVHKKENSLPVSCTLLSATECSCTLYSSGAIANLPTAIETKKLNWICYKNVGSTSTPVYVDANGQVQPCGFQVNFGTPIAGANVLNIITA